MLKAYQDMGLQGAYRYLKCPTYTSQYQIKTCKFDKDQNSLYQHWIESGSEEVVVVPSVVCLAGKGEKKALNFERTTLLYILQLLLSMQQSLLSYKSLLPKQSTLSQIVFIHSFIALFKFFQFLFSFFLFITRVQDIPMASIQLVRLSDFVIRYFYVRIP